MKPPFESLVEEHFDYLYGYAYRYFGSHERAEEVVQDAFVAATESYQRFEGRSSPKTWLVSILRHKILDRVRKKHPEESCDFATEDDPLVRELFDGNEHWRTEAGPVQWGTSPERIAHQRDFLQTLDGCLKKLPSRLREVFLLREVDGLEREEICKESGLTSTNIGVMLYRARLSLQRCLQVNWFDGHVRGKT